MLQGYTSNDLYYIRNIESCCCRSSLLFSRVNLPIFRMRLRRWDNLCALDWRLCFWNWKFCVFKLCGFLLPDLFSLMRDHFGGEVRWWRHFDHVAKALRSWVFLCSQSRCQALQQNVESYVFFILLLFFMVWLVQDLSRASWSRKGYFLILWRGWQSIEYRIKHLFYLVIIIH
jgi:hypothetical protein